MGLSEDQQEALAAVMGPLGTLLGGIMVLSGTVVIRDICKRKSVGEYSYFPYVAQMCCTALWDTYAVINWQDGKMFWPLTVNLFGLSVSTTIFAIYVTFATPKEKKAILANAGPPLGAVAAFDWYALHHPSELTIALAGTACLVSNILMYGGPLATARVAIATKSTEFLPLSLGVTTLTCSLPWCAFGFAIWDPPIFVPNVLGIVFGVFQIAVYACLKRQSRDSRQVEIEATLTTKLRDSERR